MVAAKVAAALDQGLVPLLCVGEPEEVRTAGRAEEHVGEQVRSALAGVAPADLARVLVAYEPVWAIGEGGRPAEPADVVGVLDRIRAVVAELAPGARLAGLLYGGSVSTGNAAELLALEQVDGLFVGPGGVDGRGLRRPARRSPGEAAAGRSRTSPAPEPVGGLRHRGAGSRRARARPHLRTPSSQESLPMTHVYDDPATFKDDVLVGFAAAYPGYVQRVPDASGFVRAGGPLEGKVSLVVGGGSGHYPSYSGVVGTGFADGAVLGDLFASPSAEQVYRVCKAAHGGAGLVMGFGNYAGDRLNFKVAADRLEAEGIDVRIVWVTDDIASGPLEEQGSRRGIAGTFTVYKVAGAAAEAGLDLDGVERVMAKANAATYSFGVAFDGCTMPGAEEPLFHVEPGQMDFGLGIHGEPGITSDAWMPAPALAARLVETVLAERPARRRRPRRRARERPGRDQVRGAVRPLRPRRPAAREGRASPSCSRRSASW